MWSGILAMFLRMHGVWRRLRYAEVKALKECHDAKAKKQAPSSQPATVSQWWEISTQERGKRTSRLGRMFCFCTQFRWSLGRSRVRTFWTWDWAEPVSPGFVVCIVCYKVVCKCLLQNVNLAGYMIKDRNIAHDFLLYSWARERGWLSDLDVRHQSKWVIICLNSDVVLWSFLHTREWIL